MVKCRCVLHEFSITTSTSTTKMMMIITMATMLINKRKLCQPQNVCIALVLVCAVLCTFWQFTSCLFYPLQLVLLALTRARVSAYEGVCVCWAGVSFFFFFFVFWLLPSLRFQPNYIVAMCTLAFLTFSITWIFYDRIYLHMQNSHVYVAH